MITPARTMRVTAQVSLTSVAPSAARATRTDKGGRASGPDAGAAGPDPYGGEGRAARSLRYSRHKC
jgi:hypothetical protein